MSDPKSLSLRELVTQILLEHGIDSRSVGPDTLRMLILDLMVKTQSHAYLVRKVEDE